MNHTRLLISLTTLLWTLTFVSCSHYNVVETDIKPYKSIYVHTVTNQDFAPNIHTLFQAQIRRTILRDDRLSLSGDPQDADAQMYITIDDYKRNVNTRASKDPGRFNSINLGLTITVSLFDNNKKSYLLEKVPLVVNEFLFVEPSSTLLMHREMEYQILPKITKDLSRKIIELILSDWPESKN